MDLDSLRCFVAAADTLAFRAAAAKVALSPGAFSDRLRRLEDELGAPLFVRTTRSARLTEAGHRLLPHAQRLLDAADRCREVAQGVTAPTPFALTIGTRYELGMSFLVPALDPLAAAVPERTIHLFMADTPDLLARTLRGDLDAVLFSARLTSPRLQYATIHPETYVFVGATPDVTGPDAASGHTLVDISADLPLFRYLVDALPPGPPWAFARHQYLG
ncbi:MAG: LysR family transcriptional regulator, partial [Myxococcota bacterium]